LLTPYIATGSAGREKVERPLVTFIEGSTIGINVDLSGQPGVSPPGLTARMARGC